MIEKNNSALRPKIIKVFLIMLICFAVLIVAGFYIYSLLLKPIDANNIQLARLIIPKGQSAIAVSEQLYEKNLIRHPKVFQLFYRLNQDKYNIQAGSFELSQAMSVSEILEILSDGADDIWITFPEGLRREEIAESLENYDLPAYQKSEFLLQTVGMEGKLFPDTYLVPKQITTQAIINLMSNTFDKKISALSDQISRSKYSQDEIIVMASLLEREAKGLDQMRQVSGVLFKRLQMGMSLQVDATLQYAKGFNSQTNNWWSVPLAADKQLDSKYNTYQMPGLPPSPICNPGFDALTAAADPLPSDYVYYLHDGSGQIHFAKTLEEHNHNISTYLR